MATVSNFNIAKPFSVEELFNKLDDYLIEDIEAILNARHSNGNGVGYPCLMTILSGMELIGLLLSGDEDSAFKVFWSKLALTFPKYKSNKLKNVFRQVIRNGIAHIYLTKSGIYVHYDRPENHLRKVIVNNQLGVYISCKALFGDFYQVYKQIKEDLIANPTRAHIDQLYNNIQEGQGYVNKFLESREFIEIDDGIILSLDDLQGSSGVNGDYFDSKYISA